MIRSPGNAAPAGRAADAATTKPSPPSACSGPAEALRLLAEHLASVADEPVDLHHAVGRVLAQPVDADRDSPAHDVSAMDGYAVRLAELADDMPVAGEVTTGSGPPAMPDGAAMAIFTGGCVPTGADAVIRREDVVESPGRIRLAIARDAIEPGANIRRQGENLAAGARVVDAGALIDAPVMAALASFGASRPRVYRRVRVGVIVTGDELRHVHDAPAPWQVRDSNGPALAAMFAALPWVDLQGIRHVPDTLDDLIAAAAGQLPGCDALLLTGGVSMGDHDHVPEALEAAGARQLFHRLPIRPGKPLLAAVGPQGQAILGLPGNPVSVMVTARRFALAALRRRAGLVGGDDAPAAARLTNPDDKALKLWWHRPVRFVEPGVAELVPGKGSGDVAAAAGSDGFVEIPPGACGAGPWPCWPWSVT